MRNVRVTYAEPRAELAGRDPTANTMTTTPATSSCSNTPFPERLSSRSSSASQVNTIDELRPVLVEGAIEETNGTEGDVGESKRKRLSEKLRRILVVCLLVLLIVFAACAYSMVGPFLPIEVYMLYVLHVANIYGYEPVFFNNIQ